MATKILEHRFEQLSVNDENEPPSNAPYGQKAKVQSVLL
jgi:hypothetical protein